MVIVVAYLLANLLLWFIVEEADRYKHAGDGSSWYQAAVETYKHGIITGPERPGEPDVYRPPAYTFFGAALSYLAGGTTPGLLAIGQIAILLAAGLFFRDTVDARLPGYGNTGMALLLFNPNTLSTAQYTQSDILFLFFLAVGFWAIIRYANDQAKFGMALVAGIAVALACLTRPTAQFIVPALPIVFALILAVSGRGGQWLRGLMHGSLATVLALAIMAPWLANVKAIDGQYGLSAVESRHRYIWDQITMVEAQSTGKSYHQAADNLNEVQAKMAEEYGPEWTTLKREQQRVYLLQRGYSHLLAYPAADLLTAYARSWIQFFGAAGAGRWHNLFQVSGNMEEIWFTTKQSDVWGMVTAFVKSAPLGAVAISAVCLLFVIIMRLFGLLGLVALAKRREYDMLLILTLLIIYFAMVHLFVGNSRYRIAVEPALILLAMYGWKFVRQRKSADH